MLLMFCYILLVGRGSSVSIATRYGPDGPGIESRWGRDFPHPSRPAIEPIQSPIQWIPRLFPGGKAAGSCRWSPIPSSAEVKERVELYPYSLSGSSWPVLGWTLPLPLTLHFVKIPSFFFSKSTNGKEGSSLPLGLIPYFMHNTV